MTKRAKKERLKAESVKKEERIVVKISDEDFEKFKKVAFTDKCIELELDRLIERKTTEKKLMWDYLSKKYNLAKERKWAWEGKQEIFIDELEEAKEE